MRSEYEDNQPVQNASELTIKCLWALPFWKRPDAPEVWRHQVKAVCMALCNQVSAKLIIL